MSVCLSDLSIGFVYSKGVCQTNTALWEKSHKLTRKHGQNLSAYGKTQTLHTLSELE
jgi:hypothetical protein